MSSQRATQVAAILQRRLGVDLNREVFINVPGGLDDIKDPALDLPLALALTSFALNVALPKSFIAFGEIGLMGEVRPVSYIEARIKTALLMRYETIIGPVQPSYETADIVAGLTRSDEDGADSGNGQYFPVSTVEEVFGMLEGFVIVPPEVKQSRRKKKSPFEVPPS
jgi:ATP-dependent Lon protease